MPNLKNRVYREKVRSHLIKSQHGKCCYCKRNFTPTGPTIATIEHRKAKMCGGTDELNNLAMACLHCNQHRGQQMNKARQNCKM